MALEGAKQMLNGLEDLARRGLVRAIRRQEPTVPRAHGERMIFLFTIDTEISMGGAMDDPKLEPVGADRRIWGRTSRGSFGIDRFMDIFDEHGFPAVFFFETMGKRLVGEESLEQAAAHIAGRGHDVEMHIHPEFRIDLERARKGIDPRRAADLAAYSLDEQREMIRECADDIERWIGLRPCAFRAGGYGAGRDTLNALALEGFYIDSSYNQWAVEKGYCKIQEAHAVNDITTLASGVLEVPVTNMITRGPRSGLRPFELSSLNGSEMIAVLDELYDLGYRSCCSVTHSFRLLRTRDVQYRDASEDRVNLHRLRVLCRHLAAHPDRFEVRTFRQLPVAQLKRAVPPPRREPRYPEPPAWSSLSRMAVQAVKDRGAR